MEFSEIRDELDRKTLEALEVLLCRRVAEEIDDSQLQVGIDTLFSSAAGLLSRSVVDVLSEASKIERKSREEVRVYMAPDNVQVLKRFWGKGMVKVVSRQDGPEVERSVDFSNKDRPELIAASFIAKMEREYLTRGYKRVA